MPRTIVSTTSYELERLRGLWDSLHSAGGYTLFQSFAWNYLAAKVFGAREAPLVVATEGATGASIIPACVTPSGVSLLGESLFDYRDLLARGDDDALVSAFRRLAPTHRPFHFLATYGKRSQKHWHGAGFTVEQFVGAPMVGSAASERFESCHHRSARLLRRLARLGVTFQERGGANTTLVRTIYERKGAQVLSTGENLFADRDRREFLVAACALGSCDVYTLETAGTLVSALVTFRDGNARRFYTTYYEQEWAHYSPGVALLYEATRRSLQQGFDCDYMTGEQPHKMRFATSVTPLYRVKATAEQMSEIATGDKLVAA